MAYHTFGEKTLDVASAYLSSDLHNQPTDGTLRGELIKHVLAVEDALKETHSTEVALFFKRFVDMSEDCLSTEGCDLMQAWAKKSIITPEEMRSILRFEGSDEARQQLIDQIYLRIITFSNLDSLIRSGVEVYLERKEYLDDEDDFDDIDSDLEMYPQDKRGRDFIEWLYSMPLNDSFAQEFDQEAWNLYREAKNFPDGEWYIKNRIFEFVIDNEAEYRPGVLTGLLHAEAESFGLSYPEYIKALGLIKAVNAQPENGLLIWETASARKMLHRWQERGMPQPLSAPPWEVAYTIYMDDDTWAAAADELQELGLANHPDKVKQILATLPLETPQQKRAWLKIVVSGPLRLFSPNLNQLSTGEWEVTQAEMFNIIDHVPDQDLDFVIALLRRPLSNTERSHDDWIFGIRTMDLQQHLPIFLKHSTLFNSLPAPEQAFLTQFLLNFQLDFKVYFYEDRFIGLYEDPVFLNALVEMMLAARRELQVPPEDNELFISVVLRELGIRLNNPLNQYLSLPKTELLEGHLDGVTMPITINQSFPMFFGKDAPPTKDQVVVPMYYIGPSDNGLLLTAHEAGTINMDFTFEPTTVEQLKTKHINMHFLVTSQAGEVWMTTTADLVAELEANRFTTVEEWFEANQLKMLMRVAPVPRNTDGKVVINETLEYGGLFGRSFVAMVIDRQKSPAGNGYTQDETLHFDDSRTQLLFLTAQAQLTDEHLEALANKLNCNVSDLFLIVQDVDMPTMVYGQEVGGVSMYNKLTTEENNAHPALVVGIAE